MQNFIWKSSSELGQAVCKQALLISSDTATSNEHKTAEKHSVMPVFLSPFDTQRVLLFWGWLEVLLKRRSIMKVKIRTYKVMRVVSNSWQLLIFSLCLWAKHELMGRQRVSWGCLLGWLLTRNSHGHGFSAVVEAITCTISLLHLFLSNRAWIKYTLQALPTVKRGQSDWALNWVGLPRKLFKGD